MLPATLEVVGSDVGLGKSLAQRLLRSSVPRLVWLVKSNWTDSCNTLYLCVAQ